MGVTEIVGGNLDIPTLPQYVGLMSTVVMVGCRRDLWGVDRMFEKST